MAERLYAVMDPDGTMRAVERTSEEAAARASRIAPYVRVESVPDPEADLGAFDQVPAEDMPTLALRSSQLQQIDFDAVMRMSLEQAHAKLKRYFPRQKARKDGTVQPITAYDTPEGMSTAILGQNYKTAKETPEHPSDVQGLSLLPYWLAFDDDLRVAVGARGARKPPRFNLCVGSSRACRASCLVYSGHNMVTVYNTRVKLGRTVALLEQPTAFCRMLAENVRRHVRPRVARESEPFVRLNVFSDVPWELVLPGLFEAFPEGRFYDYTKVPGRTTPKNYDLTFSWSGVNHRFADFELKRGRRIAAVFIPPADALAQWRRTADKASVRGLGLPDRWRGLPVVDGDISDVRPRDPGRTIVGLRWKVPLGQPERERGETGPTDTAFVVPVQIIDGQYVAAEASRMSPIVDADTEET